MTKRLGYLMVRNERTSFFFFIPLDSYKESITPSSILTSHTIRRAENNRDTAIICP